MNADTPGLKLAAVAAMGLLAVGGWLAARGPAEPAVRPPEEAPNGAPAARPPQHAFALATRALGDVTLAPRAPGAAIPGASDPGTASADAGSAGVDDVDTSRPESAAPIADAATVPPAVAPRPTGHVASAGGLTPKQLAHPDFAVTDDWVAARVAAYRAALGPGVAPPATLTLQELFPPSMAGRFGVPPTSRILELGGYAPGTKEALQRPFMAEGRAAWSVLLKLKLPDDHLLTASLAMRAARPAHQETQPRPASPKAVPPPLQFNHARGADPASPAARRGPPANPANPARPGR